MNIKSSIKRLKYQDFDTINNIGLAPDNIKLNPIRVDTYYKLLTSHKCKFCNTIMKEFRSETFPYGGRHHTIDFLFCEKCGWWNCLTQHGYDINSNSPKYYYQRFIPFIQLIKSIDKFSKCKEIPYITMLRFKELMDAKPLQFEQLIADLFEEYFKCKIEFFNQKNGGPDLLGITRNNDRFLVEIKKWKKHKINVSVIHRFAGQMLLQNIHKGFVVTSSDFTIVAKKNTSRYLNERNYNIVCVNHNDLIEWLEICEKRDPSIIFEETLNEIQKAISRFRMATELDW